MRNELAGQAVAHNYRQPDAPTLAQIGKRAADRIGAMIEAHATGAYSIQQIAERIIVHFTTVGKVVRRGE